jgi:capsular polysaccharide biosynthesis protein
MNADRLIDPNAPLPVDNSPDLLAVMARQWLVILTCTLIGAFAGWYYTSTRPTSYESRATVLLIAAGDERPPGGGLNRSLDVDTWATVARSTTLLQSVADELGVSLQSVRSNSSAQPSPTGDVLIISFTNPVSDDAARGAEVYSQQFLEARQISVNADTVARAESLQAQRTEAIQEIEDLTLQIAAEEAKGDLSSQSELGVLLATRDLAIQRLANINIEIASIDTNVEAGRVIIDPQTTTSETGFSVPLATIAGLLAGLLAGVLVALLRDRYDSRYASRGGAGSLGLREVGRVPYDPGKSKRSAASDYTRTLARINFANADNSNGGSAVLVLPVETVTLPPDVGSTVAEHLKTGGTEAGIVVGVWSDVVAAAGRSPWPETIAELDRLRGANDLVLVPTVALDQAALAIGLAAAVDQTLLLVSDRSSTEDIDRVLEDLQGVSSGAIDILVVTGLKRRHFNDAAR